MASTPIFPFATWASGTNQNSIPANDNSLRNQLLNGNIISQAVTAQPASPTEGDAYIIASTHTGAQWAGFTPKDLAIYSGGTWYAYAPVQGVIVNVAGSLYKYDSGAWTAVVGGAYDIVSPLSSAEISVTAATTLTLGRAHVCSGTTADYAVTLPAASGNAGKLLTLRMASGLTRWVTLTGNGAELIDGSNTRRMWARETATLLCDGTGWTKIAGRSVPVRAVMSRNTAFATPTLGWHHVPMNVVVSDNTSGLAVPAANTTTGRITTLRTGNYSVVGFCSWSGIPVTLNMAVGTVSYAGAAHTPVEPGWGFFRADAGGTVYGSAANNRISNLNEAIEITVYNMDTVSRNTQTGSSTSPALSVIEIPDW